MSGYCWISDLQLGRLKDLGAALVEPELSEEFDDLIKLVATQRLQVHVREQKRQEQ
jgi:hypothetical protein